jgi:hypothetical protein
MIPSQKAPMEQQSQRHRGKRNPHLLKYYEHLGATLAE